MDWKTRLDNFTIILNSFQAAGAEPTPAQKIVLFVTGFQLQEERRAIEINLYRIRLGFAIAEIYVNSLRTRKAIVDYLNNTNCAALSDTTLNAVIRNLILARLTFEFKAARLGVLIVTFIIRHEAVMAALRLRILAIQAHQFVAARAVAAAWANVRAQVADNIRRAIIAYLNATSCTVTVNTDTRPPSVSVTFTRTPRPGEVLADIKRFITRVIKTIIASQSGVDESKDITVMLPDPTKKRQVQSFVIDAEIGTNGSSTVVVSAIALVMAVFARF
jgi:hypothetical protein